MDKPVALALGLALASSALVYVAAGGSAPPEPVPTPRASPISGTTQSGPAVVQTPAPAPSPVPEPEPLVYVVQPGDTLADIARWFALQGHSDLFAANAALIGDNPDLIFPGQRFEVPGHAQPMDSN